MALSAWRRFRMRYGARRVPLRKFPAGNVGVFLHKLALRGFEPEVIVDVGANRGRWSRKAHLVFPHARLILVEPLVEMKGHLDAFCEATPQASWIQAGVGATMGRETFTVVGKTDSTFTFTADEARAGGFEQRTVDVITLDHVCDDVIGGVPDMVKIDAEGYEFPILEGASQLLGKTEVILLELPLLRPRRHALPFPQAVTRMSEMGYEVYDFTMFLPRPHDGAVALLEVAFARADGLLRSHLGWD